jgi:hypothetical protein
MLVNEIENVKPHSAGCNRGVGLRLSVRGKLENGEMKAREGSKENGRELK